MTPPIRTSVLYLFFFVFCSVVTAKRFPSFIEKCHLKDPNLKLCSIRVINDIKKHLSNGIPEFAFPSMDPLQLSEISLDSGNSFKATFTNVQIFHIDKMKVEDLDFNLNEDTFTFKLLFPYVRIKANYDIQGKIMFLYLNGNGPAEGNFTDVEAEVKLRAHRYKKGNKEFLKFSAMELKEKMHKSLFRFEGLFKNNPELTEQTNKIVNENVDEILEELRPSVHSAIEQTVLGLTARLFEKFSVQELFPE